MTYGNIESESKSRKEETQQRKWIKVTGASALATSDIIKVCLLSTNRGESALSLNLITEQKEKKTLIFSVALRSDGPKRKARAKRGLIARKIAQLNMRRWQRKLLFSCFSNEQ